MKKQNNLLYLLLCIPFLSYSIKPISLGISTSINYADVGDVKSTVNGTSNVTLKAGYDFGAWLRLKLLTGTFLHTAVIYSKRRTDYKLSNNEKGEYSTQIIQIPVYYGKTFLKILSVGIGPSVGLPFNTSYEIITNTATLKSKPNFAYTVSAAALVSVDLPKFGFFVSGLLPLFDSGNKTIDGTTTIDPSTKLISLGVSYKFL